jgi:hypothetical protein
MLSPVQLVEALELRAEHLAEMLRVGLDGSSLPSHWVPGSGPGSSIWTPVASAAAAGPLGAQGGMPQPVPAAAPAAAQLAPRLQRTGAALLASLATKPTNVSAIWPANLPPPPPQ